MPFCEKCGHEVNEDQAICLNCGCEIKKAPVVAAPVATTTPTSNNNSSDTFALVGFILSFFGGILALIFCILGLKAPTPSRKKLAIAGIIISVGVYVVTFVLSIVFNDQIQAFISGQ